VKLRDRDFTTRQHSRTVPSPIESNAAITAVARELLRELRSKRRVPARLLGVGLSGLVSAGSDEQLGLFGETVGAERERDRSVSRAVDALSDRFGQKAVVPGATVRSRRDDDS
jgi:DNA polymerase-4